MNKEIETLLQAIMLTEKKYGKGTTKWIDYLYHGDISCFTSTDGARDMMEPLDSKMLLKKVFVTLFLQLRSYLEKESFYSDNEVANYMIQWFTQKCLGNFEESFENLNGLYQLFSAEFETFEKRFDNHIVIDVLQGNFKKAFLSKQQFENIEKTISVLSKLMLVCEDRKEEVMAEIQQDDSVCNKPIVRKPFLDTDMERLVRAIELTEQKYGSGKGRVPFFEYLEEGTISIFSSMNGAQELVKTLDYKMMRYKVILTMLQNILSYFQTVIPWQDPANSVVVNFIVRVIWEFENSDHVADIYDEVIDNLFSNGKRNAETLAYALDILVGNITKDSKCMPKSELEIQRERTCGYLNQLIYYTLEQINTLKQGV